MKAGFPPVQGGELTTEFDRSKMQPAPMSASSKVEAGKCTWWCYTKSFMKGVENPCACCSNELRQRLVSRRRVSITNTPQQYSSIKRGKGRVFCF